MSKTRIGGVVVARGSSVKWGTLFSILAGSAVYAWFEGIIRVIQTIGDGYQTAVAAVREFVATLISLEFEVAGAATNSAWWEFWAFTRGAGPFSWLLTVLVVALVFTLVLVIFQAGVSRIVG